MQIPMPAVFQDNPRLASGWRAVVSATSRLAHIGNQDAADEFRSEVLHMMRATHTDLVATDLTAEFLRSLACLVNTFEKEGRALIHAQVSLKDDKDPLSLEKVRESATYRTTLGLVSGDPIHSGFYETKGPTNETLELCHTLELERRSRRLGPTAPISR